MLRSAYALKSLERYFLILATGVVLPVSVLTGIVVQQNWRAYASTAAASTAFTAVRCTLQTMELVSAERGPMNAALGENLPVPPPSSPRCGMPANAAMPSWPSCWPCTARR